MKKIILTCAIALLGFSVFAEPLTKASFASNFEKFMNGKGTYIKFINEAGDVFYFLKDKIQAVGSETSSSDSSDINFSIALNGNSFTIYTKDYKPKEANDISIDANGNLILQKK